MNDLAHGLAPKMKPISRKRSAIVCALDIGTSKIVCAIARLKPRPPQDVLPRRTHAIEVLGIGHTQAHGMKSGTVAERDNNVEGYRRAFLFDPFGNRIELLQLLTP